ncbi:MAG: DHH family phosphoesterase, partial [Longimicrobiales bacterium]|nr:DHH family phosphoesterase [Longimicrobiales bacterium]
MTGGAASAHFPVPPRWEMVPAPDEDRAGELVRALRLPWTMCRLLVARGHDTVPQAKDFLRPLLEHLAEPAAIRDLPRAAERILTAVDRDEGVLVHGDYDVDGVCAAALLTRWIRRLGGRAEAFAPHRLRDGYDLSTRGVERASETGAGLLVTVDCGIVAHQAVARARAAGLDVVVTDHHTPGEDLPDAWAVVNPNRPDDASGLGDLCGAGVAFQLVRHLARLRGVDPAVVAEDLDLVALATVADLVPLTREN